MGSGQVVPARYRVATPTGGEAGQQSLDQDAITAIQQTEQAVKDIAANKMNDALSDIEKATGKINI